MISPNEFKTALGWLSDLPQRPDIDPRSPEGQAWMGRLLAELQSIGATGPELVAACRAMARAQGAFFPTPGQIAEAVKAARQRAAEATREHGWRASRIAPPQEGGHAQVPGGFASRDQVEFHEKVVALIARGHAGPDIGEPYVAAVLREEAEAAAALEQGEVYRHRRYGPSLLPASPRGFSTLRPGAAMGGGR